MSFGNYCSVTGTGISTQWITDNARGSRSIAGKSGRFSLDHDQSKGEIAPFSAGGFKLNIVIGILFGILGTVAGFGLGAAGAAMAASAFHMSSREGAIGYFAGAVGILVGLV